MRKRRNLLSEHEVTREIWPSFTDVMSTMALILFVLVLLAYVQNLISGRRLDELGRQITGSEQKLRSLDEALRHTKTEIEESRARLNASQDRLHDQERVIDDSNRELAKLRARLQGIAVIRVEVLNKLKKAIEAELPPTQSPDAGDRVLIGDNGNVIINESLVFELNSYALKKDAKPLLDTLARALGNLLADPDVRENIDAIVIQGHTDERGSAPFNWDLSAKRANAVLDYLFEANPLLADSYGRYFAASAYSKFRPLNPARTEAAYQQNRRIEIAVVPKDANVRQVIDDYMQSLGPPQSPTPVTP